MARRMYKVSVILMNDPHGALAAKIRGSQELVLPGRTILVENDESEGNGWQGIAHEEARRVFGDSIAVTFQKSTAQLVDGSSNRYLACIYCSFTGHPEVADLERCDKNAYFLREEMWQLETRFLAGDLAGARLYLPT